MSFKRSRLLVAASEQSPDLFFASRFRAPDPFPWLSHKGKTRILLNDLEIDRGRRQAAVDHVDSYSEMEKLASPGSGHASFNAVLATWLLRLRVRELEVPGDFPIGIARFLEEHSIGIQVRSGSFWPEREIKTPREVTAMRKALRITETGMARGVEVLRASRPGKVGILRWGNATLTSEILRAEIDSAILRAGGVPGGTIVACGEQACDPHERGTGPLRANRLIILDVFPQDSKTGYFGDLTRTVVRGKATEEQKRLWNVCLEGQKLAMRRVAPGGLGRQIHEEIVTFFERSGYPTGSHNGRMRGFFHGTGHGLGLEIHESPRFSATKFTPGQVLTVEPGIYWPGIGGVRHEDVILITPKGKSILSRFPKPLEI